MTESLRFKILLAEDNPITTDLIVTALENKGHSVSVAENGEAAVKKWEEGAYDLILMDVQMPVMDGIEASTMIREKEKSTGKRTPILAVTAYAIDECKKSCQAAGMDDFISKPIDLKDLWDKVNSFAQGSPVGSSPAEGQSSTERTSGGRYDLGAIKKIIASDHDELMNMIKTFFSIVDERLSDIENAIRKADVNLAHASAHAIKGLAGQFGAEAMRRAARNIEDLTGDGRMDGIERMLDGLTAEYKAVKADLSAEFGIG